MPEACLQQGGEGRIKGGKRVRPYLNELGPLDEGDDGATDNGAQRALGMSYKI